MQALMEVYIYPGCKHTLEDCATFDNTDRYGGWPHMQALNPMGGQSVF
jgi:hypothetical protein